MHADFRISHVVKGRGARRVMLAFLNRLVSCKSEASLPKDDAETPPPATTVPPASENTSLLLARGRVSIGPGFTSHADESQVPNQPFVSHDAKLQEAAAPAAKAVSAAAAPDQVVLQETSSSACGGAKSEYMAYVSQAGLERFHWCSITRH